MDKRIQKTHKNLQSALINLILKKWYENITITELAKEANVWSKTFYRNFKSKDELLDSYSSKIWDDLANSHDLKEKSTTKNLIFLFFKFIKNNKLFFEAIYKSPIIDRFFETAIEISMWKENWIILENKDIPKDLTVHYIIRSFQSIVWRWLKNWTKESIEEISELSEKLIIKSFLEEQNIKK